MTNASAVRLLLTTTLFVLGHVTVLAQTPVVVTSQSALITGGNTTPAPFTNNFTGTTVGGAIDSINFSGSGGAFTYNFTVPAGTGTYLSGGNGIFLGTNTDNRPYTINFTSGNITGVGGRFWHTDVNDAFQAQPVKIDFTLSNATTFSFPAYTPADANEYRGFLFNNLPGGVTLTSMTVSAPGANFYAGLDDFTVLVATPVPEPASMLLGVGVVGLAGAAWRRRRARATA